MNETLDPREDEEPDVEAHRRRVEDTEGDDEIERRRRLTEDAPAEGDDDPERRRR